MADIETRPGNRTAWGTEQETTYMPTETNADEKATVDPVVGPVRDSAPSTERPGLSADTGVRRPMKLLAELSRAMQAAAEASRDETMARFAAEAKTVVEEIQGGSTGGAADLRRQADDDVAAIREWSKGEIARIREETDNRIAQRKTALDGEMEAHAAVVQERVERIGHRGDRVRGSHDGLLRPPARGRRSDPDRDDGRNHARAARPGRRGGIDPVGRRPTHSNLRHDPRRRSPSHLRLRRTPMTRRPKRP